MELNKNNFQIRMQELEDLLSKYKNLYPRNISEIATNFLPKGLIILSIMMFTGIISLNLIVMVMAIIIAPIILIFGIKLKKKTQERITSTIEINKITINTLNQKKQELQDDYGEYPDVKDYIEKFDEQIEQTSKHKISLERKFKKGYITVIICIIALFLCMAMVNVNRNMNFKNSSIDGFCEIFEIENTDPFLTLKPYDTKISDNITIETGSINLYFRQGNTYYLQSKEIKISGAEKDDVFRMWIVDDEGKIFDRSPKFIFSNGDSKIESYPLCYISNKNGISNKFMALIALKKLHENAGNLKFKIEKIN